MLKYGRKGMMINNGINFAIFGLTFLGVKKINLLKNQHRGLRIVANVAIAAGIYQALWYPRNVLTNQAVPFIMEKLDIKVS
jgi:predicted acyl esterase